MRTIGSIAVLGVLLAPAMARGQQVAGPVTVQLPTLQTFSVNTTVSVPDRGGMALGGVGRRREGSVQTGPWPLGRRAAGVDTAASGMSVQATIIDLAEHDRAVLAEAKRRAGNIARWRSADSPVAEEAPPASPFVRQLLIRTANDTADIAGANDAQAAVAVNRDQAARPAFTSVASIRAAQEAEAAAAVEEGERYFEQAEAAEKAGELATAKNYFHRAAKRLTGARRKEALARLQTLRQGSSATKGAD